MIHQNQFQQPITGLILSGGHSSRFQVKNNPWQDKALITDENGESLLTKAINSMKDICSEIIIMVNSDSRKNLYTKIIDIFSEEVKDRIKIKKDNFRYFCSGPTRGIASALEYISNERVLVIPVDMPLLNTRLFEEFLTHLKDNSIIVPIFSSGKIEPLVFAFNKRDLLIHSQILTSIKRSRADDFHRAVSKIKFVAVSKENEEVTSNLFTSINDRNTLAQMKLNEPIQFDNYFNATKSFIIERKENNTILNEATKYLNQNLFLSTNKENLEVAMKLHSELINSHMYFHAGLLLYGFADLFTAVNFTNIQFMKKLHSQIITNCIEAFVKEAEYWNKNGIKFLELHSYSDALHSSKITNQLSQSELENKVVSLKKELNLEKKVLLRNDFDLLIKQRAPDFFVKAKYLIQNTEKRFNENSPQFTSNFLWDHSQRVGRIAFKLAMKEGVDPLIPVIAALMHDAGKFTLGKYHKDKIAEEEHSALEAEKILLEENFSEEEIKAVKSTITALYNDKLDCSINCKIVHDADRLDKLGPLGIASFFRKLTLRGVNLSSAILTSLSRELTYIYVAPESMMTKSAREFAETRSRKGMQYFEDLLEDLSFFDIGKFNFKFFNVRNCTIILVIPESCQKCDGTYIINLMTEQGIKCEQIRAIYNCKKCNHEFIIDFCLPLINKKK